MPLCGGWSKSPMPKATIVKEILGDLQVAVHIKQACDVGSTDVSGHRLPRGVDLDESEVLSLIPVECRVVCLRVTA